MRMIAALLLMPACLIAQNPPAKASPVVAAAPKVDLGKLLIDVARMKMDTKTALTEGAFWLSPSVLEAILRSFAQEGDAAQTEALIKSIRGYQVFMVQREYLDGLGDQKTLTADELRGSSYLENDQGVRFTALDSLPTDARDFIGNFKRGMESRSKGQHFELLIFPQQDAKGHLAEQVGKPGRIKLALGKVRTLEATEVTWHYPLDALSVSRECGKCHEALSASWSYCAYCGTAVTPR